MGKTKLYSIRDPFIFSLILGIYAGAFSQGINFINNIILSRLIDTKSYANLVVIISNIAFAQNFILPGIITIIPITISRFHDTLEDEAKKKSFVLNIAFFIFATSIMVSLVGLVINRFYNFWHIPSTKYYLFICFWILFGSFDLFSMAVLNGLKEFQKMAIYATIKGILTIVLSLVLVPKLSLFGVLLANTSTFSICFFVFLFFIYRRFNNLKLNIDFKLINDYLKLSFPIFLAGFAMMPAQWGINQYLIYKKEFYIISLFGILYPWLILIQFFPLQIVKVFVPFFSDQNRDVRKMDKITTNLTVLITILLIIGFFVAQKLLLSFYRYDYDETKYMFMLILATSFFSVMNIIIGQKIILKNLYWLRAALDFNLSIMIIIFFFLMYNFTSYKLEAIFFSYFLAFSINMILLYIVKRIKKV